MEQAQQHFLATEKVGKLLMKFSLPTSLALLTTYLYNMVDQIFIGQGVGMEGIAATNVALPFITITMALALMIGDGCAANMSLCLGRGEKLRAERSLGCAATYLILFMGAFFVLGQIFMPKLLWAFGASETVYEASMTYARITLIGLPALAIHVAFTSMIRADGNPKYTMKCSIVGAVLNIILDPIFIFALDWGLEGAALATIISQWITAGLCLRYIPHFQNVSFRRANMKPDPVEAKQILKLGFPSFINQIAIMVTQVVMNNLMTTYGAKTIYGSERALSCYGMMIKLYQVAHSIFVGLASGTQPIIGYNYGAKLYPRVRAAFLLASKVSILVSIIWFAVFQLFSGPISTVFVPDDPVYREFAIHCMRLYFGAFFIYAFHMVACSFLQSIGKPGRSLLIPMLRQFVFLIPLACLLALPLGLDGALLATAITDVAIFVLALLLILSELRSWKRNGMLDPQ